PPSTPPSRLFPYTTLFRSGFETFDGDFVGVAREHFDFGAPVLSVDCQIDDRFAGVREERLGGNADRIRNAAGDDVHAAVHPRAEDRKSTRLNSSHLGISYA